MLMFSYTLYATNEYFSFNILKYFYSLYKEKFLRLVKNNNNEFIINNIKCLFKKV